MQLLIIRIPHLSRECIWMSNTVSSQQIFYIFFIYSEESIIKSCELQTLPSDWNPQFILKIAFDQTRLREKENTTDFNLSDNDFLSI